MNLKELADHHGTDKGEWQGFMPHYEKYLPGQGAHFTLVELGVQAGNSIAMWERWFCYAKIIGIDIDLSQLAPERKYSTRVELIQGSQDDAELAKALTVYRQPRVVIDDASHINRKTIDAFHAWWPHVIPGGLYVVEDTHCSYDVKHYGIHSASAPAPLVKTYESTIPTFARPVTTMDFLKRIADDVNWNHHGHNRFTPLYKDIAFVHFFPGICFIGKKESSDG